MKYITEDSFSNNWKLISFLKKHGMAYYANFTKSFVVDENAANEMKDVMMFKYVTTLPSSARFAMDAFAGCDQNFKRSVSNRTYAEHVSFEPKEPSTTGDVLDECPEQAKLRIVLSIPLLSNRESLVHCCMKQEQLSNGMTAYYFIVKTTQHDGVFRHRRSIVPKIFNGFTCTTHPIFPDTQCILTCFGYLKPGGWVSGRQNPFALRLNTVRSILGKKAFFKSAEYWKRQTQPAKDKALSACDYTKFLQ